MCEGMLAEAMHKPELAVARYRAALAGLDGADTQLFAHAVRDRLGALLGGDEGAALRVSVRAWATAEGIRDPDRMLQMMLPAPT